ncbi:tetrahydrobiopterin biosynthesis enzymes-like protein [Rhizodiscina lignyota]|uniref:dihydroneopterin aldolase n=1 Tax=Rhizodiscina lignyota TaxID=1504668 RepID=A0A9P4IVF5_9PEZI|nr:tetrahydrobiopterin biosynthesis enzymes-like protein [Rhizodiscina lignyota]
MAFEWLRTKDEHSVRFSQPTEDTIFLRNLTLSAIVGLDAWHREGREQPVVIDLRVSYDLRAAGASDAVSDTVSYSTIAKQLRATAAENSENGGNIYDLSMKILEDILDVVDPKSETTEDQTQHDVYIGIRLPRASLLAEGGIGYSYAVTKATRYNLRDYSDKFFVDGIKIPCIIGVNPHERLQKQNVIVDLTFWVVSTHENGLFRDYGAIIQKITDGIGNSSYQTLEALAAFIVNVAFLTSGFQALTVSVQKPSAIIDVAGSGVEITRDRSSFEGSSGSRRNESI